MHVAAWHRRTPESKFTKFGQTPNHAKFCGDPTRNIRDISDQKFVIPQKWAKIHQNRLLKTCSYPVKPPLCPNFTEIGETTLEKSVTIFLHPSIFWLRRGDPLGQKSPVWVMGYTNSPIATSKISSRSDDPSPRYLLPNFVDFVAAVTHKNIQ